MKHWTGYIYKAVTKGNVHVVYTHESLLVMVEEATRTLLSATVYCVMGEVSDRKCEV